MKVKSIELNNFKRFTSLTVCDIPESAKLVVLIGPNGSGKSSFLEAINHFYKYSGYGDTGDVNYLSKTSAEDEFNKNEWYRLCSKTVNIAFHDFEYTNGACGLPEIRNHFYFRSAYRNEPDFQIHSMNKQGDPTKSIRLSTLIQNDQTVSTNYQRLVADTITEIYNTANDNKSVSSLRNELVGKINEALERVFPDLEFSSLGQPLTDGNFYFSKGTSKNFNYKNLSAGEKSAFDLILDIVIQSKFYSNAIYCIDEPEVHMHTSLQGKVLRELYDLIPGQSQLWISTHSIGMLQEAEQIEKEKPNTVVFLDFGGKDFDTEQIIQPQRIGKAVLNKFYELAFGDFAKLMLPKTIVFCEGSPTGRKRKDFDKTIYSTIFADTHPDAFFISAGSCEDIAKIEETNGEIIRTLLKHCKVIKLVDGDGRTDQEIEDLKHQNIKVLKRRNLESYLLDKSVLQKLCEINNKPEIFEECMKDIEKAIKDSIERNNPPDDYKSVRGSVFLIMKQRLQLTRPGSNPDAFIRDILAPLISKDMDVYKELENEIFN